MIQASGGGRKTALIGMMLGEHGLETESIGARLLSLFGPVRLETIQQVMGSLRSEFGAEEVATPGRVHAALLRTAPELVSVLKYRGLVDHQRQDLALAVLLMTHPALPRESSLALLLSVLGGWQGREIAGRIGLRATRVEARLQAGIRRMQVLRLRMKWPRKQELSSRVEHALEVVTGLPEIRPRTLSGAETVSSLLRMTTRIAEELRHHPNTGGRVAELYYWRSRFREVQAGSSLAAG